MFLTRSGRPPPPRRRGGRAASRLSASLGSGPATGNRGAAGRVVGAVLHRVVSATRVAADVRGVAGAAFLSALLLAGCAPAADPPETRPPAPATVGAEAELDGDARRWVEETLPGLTLREKAGQIVSVWISGGYVSADDHEMESLERLVDEGIGAVTISIGLPHEYAARLNALQARARVPLLVASDFESGGPGMRMAGIHALPSLLDMGGGTELPPTMAFGAIGEEAWAREAGRITGAEARAVGVHVAFAPVLDVNSNPENPIINTRAFGEDPDAVARLGTAFIRGAREAGLLTTGKHFPGHGDTREDSHIELAVVPGDRLRLDTLELVPFRRAIEEGVDAIMTAHVALPAILGREGPPATLSPVFMTELLREELGFRGLLYTDAMTMGAIVEAYETGEAAVLALEAGADIILSPPDPLEAIRAIVAAVDEGRVEEARLDASVRRVLEAKARAGLHRGRAVPMEAIRTTVGIRAHREFADSAAVRSLVLPRDVEGLVPLDTSRVRRVLSVTYGPLEDVVAGRAFDRRLAGAGLEVRRARVHPETPPAVWDSLAAEAAVGADLVLVSGYLSPRPWAGTVRPEEGLPEFVERVRAAGRPAVLVSFGSPYLLSELPRVESYLIAWGGRPVSQRAAADALLGRVPIAGRLPISLPPFHDRGDGLRRPVGELPPVSVSAQEAGSARDLEAAGVDGAALERLDRILRVAVADSTTPGAALAVWKDGYPVRLRGYGRTDWRPDAPAVTDSTLYDLASVTKAVGTATAILLLAEEGRLELDDPVARWLPEWAGGPLEGTKVRDLLLHRGGLPAHRPLWREAEGRRAYRAALARLEPAAAFPPGESTRPAETAPPRETAPPPEAAPPAEIAPPPETAPLERAVLYSDLGYIALGLVAEEAAGEPLDAYLERRLFRPLEMSETGFRPDPVLRARTAPTERDTLWRGRHLHGEVHDENAHALGGVAGHAGLFSSARDLSAFAAAVLDGTVPALGTSAAAGSAGDEGLAAAGFPGQGFAGKGWSPRAFGQTGFTGTSLWIDPELDLFVILLTNRVNPTRENRAHVALRRAVHEAVLRAVRGASPAVLRAVTDVPPADR